MLSCFKFAGDDWWSSPSILPGSSSAGLIGDYSSPEFINESLIESAIISSDENGGDYFFDGTNLVPAVATTQLPPNATSIYQNNYDNDASWIGHYRYYFLPFQQLSRTTTTCPLVEAFLAFIICTASIAANIACIANFYGRGIYRELMFLITLLGIFNITCAVLGIIKGVSRLSANWLFGNAGCYSTAAGWMAVSILIGLVMSLITNEQRRYLVTDSYLLAANPASSSFSSKSFSTQRLIKVVAVVIFAVVLIVASVAYLLAFIQIARMVSIDVPTTNSNGTATGNTTKINVCVVYYGPKVPNWVLIAVELTFFMTAFAIPFSVMTVNYISIWRRLQSAELQKSAGAVVFQRHQRRQCLVIFTMLSTLLLFFACTLPVHLASWFVLVSRITGESKMIQSSVLFLCTCLVNLRATVNPILQIIVSQASTPSSRNNSNGGLSTTSRVSKASRNLSVDAANMRKSLNSTGQSSSTAKLMMKHSVLTVDSADDKSFLKNNSTTCSETVIVNTP